MRLVVLAKEKDRRLYQAELTIRRYRTRLVRWFEDMVFDPLENGEMQFDGEMPAEQDIKLDLEVKKE
ncbi:Conserved_hypothetical protein [Hexamita inflata]|uniref:Uncharacterized protein n=1 Tax=Hexamita inflata TaxID=28002 RepID=A0AA86V4J1_9EUKA|nr:Conserved hypothetical protein [Hexamita inflata]CAI9931294.1 Conserved hypothetical protein [Hexamita inflata]CAI9976092.1 Conserved hypothetical protein [Hexamita inflata]